MKSNAINNEIFDLIKKYFNGDTSKTFAWFYTVNPALGNVSPLWMMKIDRSKKLLKFIKNSLEGNYP